MTSVTIKFENGQQTSFITPLTIPECQERFAIGNLLRVGHWENIQQISSLTVESYNESPNDYYRGDKDDNGYPFYHF